MTQHLLPRSVLALLTLACACYAPADPVDEDAESSESSGDPATTASTTAGTTATSAGTTAGTTVGTSADDSADTSDEESSSGDEADASSDEETTAGATVPSVVETAPSDGESGVLADAAFVVHFSEAMDQAATQAAYQSADVPAAAVTFAWNDAGDELTITPNAALAYAMGYVDVAPLEHGFTITTAASSLAGVMMDHDVDVSFTTLRRIEQVVERSEALSGNVAADNGALGSLFFGDRNTNEHVCWAVTFDTTELAADVAALESAELRASWNGQSGNPWTGLGGGTVFQHVVYTGLDGACEVAAEGSASGLFGGIGDVDVMRDVAGPLDAVLADPDAYDSLLQLRIRWLLESDNDGAYDSVSLVPEDLELHLTYLAP